MRSRGRFPSVLFTAALVLFATRAGAALVRQSLDYAFENQKFTGYLVYDPDAKEPRPGILVFPEWWGLNEYAKMRADQLAAFGYAALAVDIYGDAKTTSDAKTAAQWSGEMKKSDTLKNYAQAALAALGRQPGVDPRRLAAIGFCFGGTAALTLAYAGADLKGAVCFHGGLFVPAERDLAGLKAKLLILHGAGDPVTPPETVLKFQDALEKSGKDWQMTLYGGAVHAFTNPKAGDNPKAGAAYNPAAAARSWEAMRTFLKELFP